MRYFETSITVRFPEVDTYGIVWHGHYAIYLEMGRLALCKHCGLSLAEMHALGFYAPVVEMKIRFRSPAKYGDELTLLTGIEPTDKAMLTFKYMLKKKDSNNTLVAEAETTHVLLSTEGKMIYRATGEIREKLHDLKAWGNEEQSKDEQSEQAPP